MPSQSCAMNENLPCMHQQATMIYTQGFLNLDANYSCWEFTFQPLTSVSNAYPGTAILDFRHFMHTSSSSESLCPKESSVEFASKHPSFLIQPLHHLNFLSLHMKNPVNPHFTCLSHHLELWQPSKIPIILLRPLVICMMQM